MKTIRHAVQLVLAYAAAMAAAAGSMGLLAFLLARLFSVAIHGAQDVCEPTYYADFFR